MTFENQINQIVGSSSFINNVIATPSDFLRVVVNINKNCCIPTITGIVDLTYLNTGVVVYGSQINYFSVNSDFNLKIVGLKYINTKTGNVFSIDTISPGAYINLTTSTLTTGINLLTTTTNAFLNANFSISAAITGSGVISSGILEYNIGNLPETFLPYSIDVIDNNTTLQTSYAFLLVQSGSQFNVPYISSQGLYIPSAFLQSNIGRINEGVYAIQTTYFYNNGSSVMEQGCIFVDVDMKCLITNTLCRLSNDEQINLLMYHYSLTEGANCDCNNCTYLCDIYKEVYKTLNIECGTSVNTTCNC